MYVRWISTRCAAAMLSLLLAAAPVAAQSSVSTQPFPSQEILNFTIEWRLITAGSAQVTMDPSGGGWQTHLNLQSTGLVSKLYKVNDLLTAHYENQFCIENSSLNAQEGKRRRDTHVSYDRHRGKANYVERDMIKNAIVKQDEIDVPKCVHDVVGALIFLRMQNLEPGRSIEIPISDGKKWAPARVEAQERETLKINRQVYKTIRYEAFIFNKVIYSRSGRLLLWLTEDGRHVPVQIQIRTGFPIGTVTLQLDSQKIS